MQSRNLGTILLAIWLILTGLLPLVTIQVPGAELILAILPSPPAFCCCSGRGRSAARWASSCCAPGSS